jgi:hypothetical protein
MLELASLITIFIVAAMIIIVVATFGGLVYLLLYLVNKYKNNKE